jgi:hypothetical protein
MSSLSLSSVRGTLLATLPPPPTSPPPRLRRGPCIFSKTPGWRPIQGWAKLVLIALERYSVALKRLTFNLR